MLKKFQNFPFSAFLLMISILTYAPFFWERGFYWDEVPWTWIYFRLGPDALTQTFSTSRPFWGMLYQVTLPILGSDPWVWHLSLVFFRYLSAYLSYSLIKTIWPDRPTVARNASILFLVYPGLSQNFMGLMYTHFYIVLSAFIYSFLLTGCAIQKRQVWWHLPSLMLSIANILMMEYFYFLELLRPLYIWAVLGKRRSDLTSSLRHSSPYMLSFLLISIWRMFYFPNQNASYPYGTLEALKNSPLDGLLGLLKMVATSFWNTSIAVWFRTVEIFEISKTGFPTFLGAIALAAIIAVLLFIIKQPTVTQTSRRSDFLIGLIIWVFSGGAFWLVGSRTLPQLHFSTDRFTLPFMFSAALLAAFSLELLRSQNIRRILLVIMVAFSTAWQFTINRAFVRDREEHDRFFSQLIERVPSIPIGTTIITNDLPFQYYSDNSLSGTLNWLYSRPGEMDTILYYASVRSQEGRALSAGFEPGFEFSQNYLAKVFNGNTDQVLVFEYAPPACLRLLDPEIDPLNKLLPPDLREASALSLPTLAGNANSITIPDHLNQVSNPWCDLYQSASLAAVEGNWIEVMNYYSAAEEQGLSAQSPMEKLIFIEAAANLGDWKTAVSLTREVHEFSKASTSPSLCALWNRIRENTIEDEIPKETFESIIIELECSNL